MGNLRIWPRGSFQVWNEGKDIHKIWHLFEAKLKWSSEHDLSTLTPQQTDRQIYEFNLTGLVMTEGTVWSITECYRAHFQPRPLTGHAEWSLWNTKCRVSMDPNFEVLLAPKLPFMHHIIKEQHNFCVQPTVTNECLNLTIPFHNLADRFRAHTNSYWQE